MPQLMQTEKLLSRNFVLTTLSTLVVFTSFYFLLITLPIYIQQLGGTESQIGLIIGVFTISAVLLLRVLHGFGFGSVHPTLIAFLVDRVGEKGRGAAMGTFTAAFDLGIGAGSILLGVVLQFFGFRIMYMLGAVAVLLGALLFLIKSKGEI